MAKKKIEEAVIINKEELFANDLDSFLSSSIGVDVRTLSEVDQVPYWIHSGSYALNWILADDMFKGIPGSKVMMISGENSKGKSLLSDVILGNNVKIGGLSYKLDVEDASAGDFTSKVIGDEKIANQIRLISPSTVNAVKKAKGDANKLNPTDLVITIEKLTTILNKLVDYQLSKGENKAKSIVISIDSVSQLSSQKEVEDISDSKDTRDMTSQQKMRALFRVINQKLKDANVTIIGIAHLTANIGVMFGEKQTISAKGTGFKYSSSLNINMVSSKEIIDPKTNTPIGVKMKLKTTKNRLAYKGRETFLYMYFAQGIDEFGGLGELLAQYGLATASAKPKLDGGYGESVIFKYTTLDGKELKWKSNELKKVANDYGADKLIKEMNERLTAKYQEIIKMSGITEDEYLDELDSESEDYVDDVLDLPEE